MLLGRRALSEMVLLALLVSCNHQTGNTQLAANVWIPADLEWRSEVPMGIPDECAGNGFVLLFDSTGYYKRLFHELYRTPGSDTITFGAEGSRVWAGAWVRKGNTVFICSRLVFDYFAPSDSGLPGPMVLDSLRVKDEPNGHRLIMSDGRPLIPWKVFGVSDTASIFARDYAEVFKEAQRALR